MLNKLKDKLRKVFVVLVSYFTKIFLILAGYLPARKKMIMFESFSGRQYSCNPRAIYEYMVENHPEYEMYWSIDRRHADNFKEYQLKTVKRYSVKWLYVLGFSRFWVINGRMPLTIPKPRHTRYIQTWHGTPLKKLVFDMKEVHMANADTEKYKENFYKESRGWDVLLSPNHYSTEIFKRAFRFDKEIVEAGYPRNDVLYTGNSLENIQRIKERLGLPLDKKVILYAPTWRDNQFYRVGQYKFDLPIDLKELQKRYGQNTIILLRMHYLVAENFDLRPYEGFAYDFSQKVDINDLYLVSDLLITDYSSVFFDYANVLRPMLFYTYDIEEYRDVLRGFYFDIEKEVPGPLVKEMTGLIKVLDEFHQLGEFALYRERYQEFYQKYCYLEDGKASKRVVEQTILNPKKN